MKFIATERGVYNDTIINVGQEFEADKDDLMATRVRDGNQVKEMCSWAVPAKDFEPAPEEDVEKLAADAIEGLQGKKKAKKKVTKKTAAKA
jgi:hypothetical protein